MFKRNGLRLANAVAATNPSVQFGLGIGLGLVVMVVLTLTPAGGLVVEPVAAAAAGLTGDVLHRLGALLGGVFDRLF